MDLLERYLQAIGEFLPEKTKADTLAELRANLLEQMDARAEELGRPLTDADVAAILKAHGKPQVVALRYLPQRSLIGPTIFPFYLFTMRKVLPLVVFVYAIANGIALVTSHHASVTHALVGFAFGLIPTLLTFWAVMTIVFAVIEYAHVEKDIAKKWNEWDPAKLPALKPDEKGVKTKSMWRRVFELGIHCVWMAYVLSIPWHAYWRVGAGTIGIDLDSFGVTFSPAWHTFYVLLVVLLTVQLMMKMIAIATPAASFVKVLKVATDLLSAAALAWMGWTSVFFIPAQPGADLQQIATVNYWMSISFRIAVVFALAGLAKELWTYGKKAVPRERLAF